MLLGNFFDHSRVICYSVTGVAVIYRTDAELLRLPFLDVVFEIGLNQLFLMGGWGFDSKRRVGREWVGRENRRWGRQRPKA